MNSKRMDLLLSVTETIARRLTTDAEFRAAIVADAHELLSDILQDYAADVASGEVTLEEAGTCPHGVVHDKETPESAVRSFAWFEVTEAAWDCVWRTALDALHDGEVFELEHSRAAEVINLTPEEDAALIKSMAAAVIDSLIVEIMHDPKVKAVVDDAVKIAAGALESVTP